MCLEGDLWISSSAINFTKQSTDPSHVPELIDPSHHPSVLAVPYGDRKWISSAAAPSNTDDDDDDYDDYSGGGGYYYYYSGGGGEGGDIYRYHFRIPPTP